LQYFVQGRGAGCWFAVSKVLMAFVAEVGKLQWRKGKFPDCSFMVTHVELIQ
jgi:hypothetical protein